MHGVLFSPLTGLTFLPPSPFEAGVHGPGALGTSLSYPIPSTIAGALASLAWRNGLCAEDLANAARRGDFEDQRLCLQRLFQERTPVLRPGLLVGPNGKLYVYLGGRRFPRIDVVRSLFKRFILETKKRDSPYGYALKKAFLCALRTEPAVAAMRRSYTGIALDRPRKKPKEGYIYTLESITYHPPASILVLTNTPFTGKYTVKLGKRQGAAHILPYEIKENPLLPREDNLAREWIIVLLTPALLRNPPGEPGNPIVLDANLAASLARELLKRYGIKAAEIKYAPKQGATSEHGLEIQYAGWSQTLGNPRNPYLQVPPGTIIHVREMNVETAAQIATHGLGEHSDLGWGTTLLIPI